MDFANSARLPPGARGPVGATDSRSPLGSLLRSLHVLEDEARDELKERRLPDAAVSVDHFLRRSDHPERIGLRGVGRRQHEGFVARRASQGVGAEARHEAERVGDAPLLQIPDRCFGDRVANAAERKHRAYRLVVLRLRANENRKLPRRAGLEGGARHQIVNRNETRALDRRIHQEHQVGEFRRHAAGRRGSGLDQRLGEGGKDDHAAEAVAHDHQERVSEVLLLAVAIMAQPAEQLPNRSDRHPLSGRLPLPERGVRDDVAQAKGRYPAPADKNPKDRTRRDAGRGARSLVIDRLAQKHTKRGEVLVVRAGVVLPSMHEDDQNHVLPWLRGIRRQGVEPFCDAVHLSPVVAPPLIVELDDRKLVRSAGHEAVDRLVRRVRHEPGNGTRLDGRKALEAVIRRQDVHRVPPSVAAKPLNSIAPTAPHEVRRITVRRRAGPRRSNERSVTPPSAAGHAASSARSAATKASGWSIIT